LNRLFVVNKPINISSNFYLQQIKQKYKIKKAGFSGILDPFACGCLIIAFGKYAQLFQFLNKTPKIYRATIWLGAFSYSFDNENIKYINKHKIYDINLVKTKLQDLIGTLKYYPPKYSAKKINGKRAYNMARDNIDFNLKQIESIIYNVKFIDYNHPFISFEITVSEGSYIRSIVQEFLKNINAIGTLSYLKRLKEGKFMFENEKALNPLKFLTIKDIKYFGSKEWIKLGKKISPRYLEHNKFGKYVIKFDDFFSIIEIKKDKISYVLNRIDL
jgi:tRNA pseudouridine55 synthase